MAKSVSNISTRLKDLVDKKVWFRTQHKDMNIGVIQTILGMDHAMIVTSNHAVFTVHANDIFLTKEDLISANAEKRRG